jgi:FKBP-type peptidyl-prolyl cis-trans isomerase FklB
MGKGINRKLLIFVCFLLVTPTHLLADENVQELTTQKEKESYSIGYQVGLSIKTDDVEVDFDRLVQGLRNAIDGNESLISFEEMKALIMALKEKARDAALRKSQEQIVKNAEIFEKFLAENGKKDGVKTTESGLQYKIIKDGDGLSPKEKDSVSVHYRGTFIDGQEFDSSYARGEPQRFQTDAVIKGWTEALQMMKVGSQWEIFVPPDLAYGRSGMGQKIPPNSVLVFQIELLSIEKEKEAGES